MRSPRPFRATVFVLCAVGPAAVALGDGKFFRSVTVAEDPTIPSQRAAIIYRDGIETLIVESDIEHAEKEMGWILPLPAPPTAIEPCAPYTLSSLATQLQPKIEDDGGQLLFGSVLILTIVCLYCALLVMGDCAAGLRVSMVRIALGVLIGFSLISSLVLSGVRVGSLSATDPTGVHVLTRDRAGVYDVEVLRAENVTVLIDWLDSNGFAWSPAANTVLGEYVRDGWCFAVSRVAGDASQTVTQHPLAFTFPAAHAVYPMKLTGVGNDEITLDLFVVGDQGAKVDHMDTWVSDSFAMEKSPTSLDGFKVTSPPYAQARLVSARVGATDITQQMWPRCVLTRLRGHLTASQMSEDVRILWTTGVATRAAFHSPRSTRLLSGSAAAAFATVLVCWFTRSNRTLTMSVSALLRRRGPVVLVAACAVYLVCNLSLPTIPVVDDGGFRTRYAPQSAHLSAFKKLMELSPEHRTPEVYRALLPARFWTNQRQLTCGQINEPGDYVIEQSDDGWSVTFLKGDFVPATIAIPSGGAPDDDPPP